MWSSFLQYGTINNHLIDLILNKWMDVFNLHYINILVLVMVSFTLFYNHFQLEYYVIAIFTIVCFYYSLFFASSTFFTL